MWGDSRGVDLELGRGTSSEKGNGDEGSRERLHGGQRAGDDLPVGARRERRGREVACRRLGALYTRGSPRCLFGPPQAPSQLGLVSSTPSSFSTRAWSLSRLPCSPSLRRLALLCSSSETGYGRWTSACTARGTFWAGDRPSPSVMIIL